MAKMIQVPYNFDISLPIETAQSVQGNRENPISLEALGLLVNLLSYPSTWDLHKLELYKRFGKNKKTSIMNAWSELVKANYIIDFRYRSGKKFENVYYFRKVPFSPSEKSEILDTAIKTHGQLWGSDFGNPKMGFPKTECNQKTLLNKTPLYNNNNLDIAELDDDNRTSAKHNEHQINLIISCLREVTKDDLNERSFKSIVRKVVDKYTQGKIGEGKFRDYLITSLLNKIHSLEERRLKESGKPRLVDKVDREVAIRNTKTRDDIPIYNWLE